MLYFIELSQFSIEDFAQTKELRAQMESSMGRTVRWVEWDAHRASTNSWPDITLINAARLGWNELKSIVNQCSAETIVLTGREDSLLGLPTLPQVDALDDLLAFMPTRSTWTALSMTSRNMNGFHRRHGEDINTTPMRQLPVETCRFEDLAVYPIISFQRASPVYRDIPQGAAVGPQVRISHFSSLGAMTGLVRSGFGMALLPQAVVAADIAKGALLAVDVRPAPTPLPLVASQRGEHASPLVDALLLLAQKVCDGYLALHPQARAG